MGDNDSRIRLTNSEIKDAIQEANRCLNCKSPACKSGCPISNDIPEFVSALACGDFGEARRVIARKSSLPAVCGRVCAHELQCEGHCILGKKGRPIRIGMLEKVVADFGFEMELPIEKIPRKTRGSVAVIGSGPAGLTIAGDLAKSGFAVSVYEALEEAGGILLYGIPSFRLSKKIVRREIKNIEALGVQFHNGYVIGVDITIDELFAKGYEAIFIGSGAAVPKELDLPGKDLEGVVQSSYLLRMNYLYRSGQLDRKEVPVSAGDEVLVIGAGNAGMDAARTAMRLGAKAVTVVYRGTKESMPALKQEYDAALKDGVQFLFECSPKEYIGSGGKIKELRVLSATNGDMSLAANSIFLAIGSRPANRIVSTAKGIDVDKDGYVVIRERPYGMTSRRGVFAGGDVVHRPATVVTAMKEAKKVAEGITEYVDAVRLLELAESEFEPSGIKQS